MAFSARLLPADPLRMAAMYTVADVMTRKVVTLKEDDDLGLADSILKMANLRHLPVVRGGKLVGLVTHRDLLRAFADRGALAGKVTRAKDVMTTRLSRVQPSTSLRKAVELMLTHKYGCLPVVEGEKLVGLVTEADLVRFAAELISELDHVEDVVRSIGVSPQGTSSGKGRRQG